MKDMPSDGLEPEPTTPERKTLTLVTLFKAADIHLARTELLEALRYGVKIGVLHIDFEVVAGDTIDRIRSIVDTVARNTKDQDMEAQCHAMLRFLRDY